MRFRFRGARGPWLVVCFALCGLSAACQDYPFELRQPNRVDARQISEVVAQLTPADILFVVDNSGSMDEEISELQRNLDRFIQELSKSDNQFQVGIVTTDIECNVPNNDCLLPDGSVNPAPTTSSACCFQRQQNPDASPCVEVIRESDGVVTSSTCDGGRLRSATPSGRRFFSRPTVEGLAGESNEAFAQRLAEAQDEFVAEVKEAIEVARNNLRGSTYEAGLLAAVTAIACSVGDASCPDQAVGQLNEGFVREDADLVLIFLTDEDDCSVASAEVYTRPTDVRDPQQQSTHFCSDRDCYAYYADGQDRLPPPDGGNGVNDIADEITCNDLDEFGNFVDRSVDPPRLDAVESFIDRFALLKGDVSRIRAAGIISSIPNASAELGFSAAGCFNRPAVGPSDNCGCLAGVDSSRRDNTAFCRVTELNGQGGAANLGTGVDPGNNGNLGCEALPSGRYADFLERLGNRRVDALRARDVLIDSICNSSYDQTLTNIVNNVILSNCFALGQVPNLAAGEDIGDQLLVTLNGSVLSNVSTGSVEPGWSWTDGSDEICLEGGLSKSINDEVEILLLQ